MKSTSCFWHPAFGSLLLVAVAGGCGVEALSSGGLSAANEYGGAWNDPGENTERYSAVGTNPFVIAAHDPLSTFAADVDTASYDIVRRDIGLQMLPQPASVRLEEYVNVFSYDYPTPVADASTPFAITMAAAPNLVDSSTTILRVGIQGKVVPPGEKKQANIVFLVDTSGSMSSSTKLPLVKEVLKHTLEILDPTDRIAIVTYAGSTRVALESTVVAEYDTIAARIDSFTAGGSTAGASGIDLAYQQALAGHIDGGINHVVLCTDGDFNVGRSRDGELVSLIEEKKRSGITLTVLGFGYGNLNDSMMEKLSNAGDGTYAVISSQTHAQKYVEHHLLSTVVQIAKDMKIQVEFNPAKVHAYRLLGYENRDVADTDFRDDNVDGGEVGSGHRVTALYELVLAGESIPEIEGAPEPDDGDAFTGTLEVDAEDLVLVKVRYKQPGALTLDPAMEVTGNLAPAAIAASHNEADDDLQWAIAIAAFAEILKQSPFGTTANLDTIAAIASDQANRDDDRFEFAQLFDTARALIEAD